MRVLLFRSLCDTGGVSTSMLLLGDQLRARGVEVEYWFCQGSKRLADFHARGGTTLAGLSKLAPRLARGDFDVVHMTSTDPAAPMVAALRGPHKVVVTARGAIADIWNSRNCHAFTAISRGMAEMNQPYTDLEVEVVRNAIDVSRYDPPLEMSHDDGPIVAFVGRTTAKEKDFPRFTRIAAAMQTPGVRVWIADPHQATLEKFGGEVGRIEPERWSRIPHAEIPDFYRGVAASGGVVLITSLTEGFGNVAPEAAACGARVAAPNVMGLREAVVDGVTGMLFPGDASDADVAARLDAWLAKPHDAATTAAAAKREFSPSVLVESFLSIYTRQEQRLAPPNPPRAPDSPEFRHLMRHLEQQRGWRAEFALKAAVDFGLEGARTRALGAVASALRLSPRWVFGAWGARQVLSVAKSVVLGRRARD